jgi:hypothetical protein
MVEGVGPHLCKEGQGHQLSHWPRAGMPAPHGMSKSARECRAEGLSWLHVPYFQYDGLGGVKGTVWAGLYFVYCDQVGWNSAGGLERNSWS